LFDEQDPSYSRQFKIDALTKIKEWLSNLKSGQLLIECKIEKRDDYFNLIQFYLRERFPTVALYEKKQNATIVLTRSLFIIFIINPILYSISSIVFCNIDNLVFSKTATALCISSLLCSIVFYYRFKQDQKYHAMYIIESFLATKRLLKKKKTNNSVQ